MATILPGVPPTFDRNDVAGTVKRLCDYSRGMQENLDFLLAQIKKDISAHQEALEKQAEAIVAAQNAAAAASRSVQSLASSYSSLAARVAALEQKNT